MTQAAFFYQTKIDPSWLLAPPVAPDLSWLAASAPFVPHPERRVSGQADPSTFVVPAAAPDLSWLGASPAAIPSPHRGASTHTAPLGWLVPPLEVTWLAPSPSHHTSRPRVASARSDPSSFVPPTTVVDLAWLTQQAMTPALRRQVGSHEASAAGFLAIVPPPSALFTPIGLDRAAGHLVVREQAPGQIVAEER